MYRGIAWLAADKRAEEKETQTEKASEESEIFHIDAKFGCGGIIAEGDRIVRYPPIFSALTHLPLRVLVRYYTVTKITKVIERKCWNCFELLEPTEETFATCRFFKCPKCGAKVLWHDDPAMDGSYAEKHKYKDGGFSSLSMMNDPENNVFGQRKYPDPPGPDGPFRKRIDGKTFRWHKGRERWVLWET